MNSKTYLVTTKHPAGYMDGTHELTVSINSNGTRYVKGKGFGCSRDYIADSDSRAIKTFLPEHGMTAVKIVSN